MTDNAPAPVRITSRELDDYTTVDERQRLTFDSALELARERKAAEVRQATVSTEPATEPPPVESLTSADLGAVLRNDTATYAGAGTIEVPAAILELGHRARSNDTRVAEPALDELRKTEGGVAAADAAVRHHREQADTAEPGILAQNGYAAIRAAMLGVCSSLGGIPREAVAAAIEYNAAAVRRLRLGVGNDPRAAAALEAATREARYLVAVSRMHRDLHDIEERLAAADRIAGR